MKKHIVIAVMTSLLAAKTFAYDNNQSALTYSNTDFNQTQPGWADTLTIYNHTANPVVITQLQFDTNYSTLDTSELDGSILHPQQTVVPEKISDYDYRYTISTESPYSKGTYTTIPANGSVTLTQIPIAHDQTSINGVPVYYRLPYNVKVVLQDGTQVALALNGQCQGAACNDPAAGKIISAYYTDWANYHYSQNPQNMLMPNQIPINDMNTVFYAIGKIDSATAAISFVDINHDQNYLPAFDTLKQQYPYLNLIYSFGGWGDANSNSYPSHDLAAIFDQQNPVLLQQLADNMINTMLTLGFNGIDIDYEWNAVQPGTTDSMTLTTARATGYQQLLQDIRNNLDKIQPANDQHYYKLTSAVFSGPDKVTEFVNNGGDWSKVATAVDFISIMAYDMHGQFDVSQNQPDNITDFQSGMHDGHQYQSDNLNHYDVVDAVTAYEQHGVPSAKIVVGIPAYTRIEKSSVAVTNTNEGLFLSLANNQPGGESNSGGTTDYKCILNNNYCWGGFTFNRTSLVAVPANLSGQGPGSADETPWAYDTNQNWFMSFDNSVSATYKAQWARTNNLHGVMVWEIDGDIPVTDTNYARDSIMHNTWQVFVKHA